MFVGESDVAKVTLALSVRWSDCKPRRSLLHGPVLHMRFTRSRPHPSLPVALLRLPKFCRSISLHRHPSAWRQSKSFSIFCHMRIPPGALLILLRPRSVQGFLCMVA